MLIHLHHVDIVTIRGGSRIEILLARFPDVLITSDMTDFTSKMKEIIKILQRDIDFTLQANINYGPNKDLAIEELEDLALR